MSETVTETTVTVTTEPENRSLTIKLRKRKPEKKVEWSSDTVDNEHMGRRSSKCECGWPSIPSHHLSVTFYLSLVLGWKGKWVGVKLCGYQLPGVRGQGGGGGRASHGRTGGRFLRLSLEFLGEEAKAAGFQKSRERIFIQIWWK